MTTCSPSHYVPSADGTPIAYRVQGSGSPLVLVSGLTTSDFFWRHTLPRWTTRHRVVTWDFKGHGESGSCRDRRSVTVPALVDDLRRVLDAAGVERAPLVGFSMGVQVVLEACRWIPERIESLVCLLGPAGRLFDTALGPVGGILQKILTRGGTRASALAMEGAAHFFRSPVAHRAGRLLGLIGPDAPAEDIDAYVHHFARLDFATVRLLALEAGRHDASDMFEQIEQPTLVVAGGKDVFAPPERVGIVMHERIVRSELLFLPHGTHTSLFEHPHEIATGVERFLERGPEA